MLASFSFVGDDAKLNVVERRIATPGDIGIEQDGAGRTIIFAQFERVVLAFGGDIFDADDRQRPPPLGREALVALAGRPKVMAAGAAPYDRRAAVRGYLKIGVYVHATDRMNARL